MRAHAPEVCVPSASSGWLGPFGTKVNQSLCRNLFSATQIRGFSFSPDWRILVTIVAIRYAPMPIPARGFFGGNLTPLLTLSPHNLPKSRGASLKALGALEIPVVDAVPWKILCSQVPSCPHFFCPFPTF